jgi:GT2 family glycosyltransferase
MNKTVVLIFSYKRPLQLDACLKSLRELCSDYKDTDVNVLYRVDDERFDNTYKKVANENKGVIFFRETDFRKNVLEIIDNYKYIMFLTDDNIFV